MHTIFLPCTGHPFCSLAIDLALDDYCQAISSSGASTVILFQCRFEKMAYTALRCVDFSSISISECLFDRNGSVIALGGSGVGKIRASSLVRSRFGTFYITHGGTQYTVLDVDVASMRSITAHSKLWRDDDRPGQMLVSRRMAISSNIDSGVLGAFSSAYFRS